MISQQHELFFALYGFQYILKEKRLVASLYTVYFDESGTHVGSDAAVVAGFVSNVTEWKTFTQKWQHILTDSGLKCFHMSEFEAVKGQFSGWSKDARHSLLNKLLSIIDEHTFSSIGCVVTRHSFDSILSNAAKQICGDTYGLAALACWRHLGVVLKENDAWMDCTMEAGAKGSGSLQLIFEEDSRFLEWTNDHRIWKLKFGDKRSFPPLQAADILAYELWKQWARQSGKEMRNARYPLRVLGKKRHQWHYVSEKVLKEFNDDINRQLARE